MAAARHNPPPPRPGCATGYHTVYPPHPVVLAAPIRPVHSTNPPTHFPYVSPASGAAKLSRKTRKLFRTSLKFPFRDRIPDGGVPGGRSRVGAITPLSATVLGTDGTDIIAGVKSPSFIGSMYSYLIPGFGCWYITWKHNTRKRLNLSCYLIKQHVIKVFWGVEA